MIPPSTFVNRMEKHWIENLKNVPNEPLRRSWKQFGVEVINHINAHDTPEQEARYTVLSPPTGSGKTEGAIVYCSMLSGVLGPAPQLHPGVLIATKRIEDANTIAERINRFSREYTPELPEDTPIAVAYHSESKQNYGLTDLRNHPVLVITHTAYKIALEMLGSHSTIPMTWEYFHAFRERTRKLVIIDEAVDLVEESQVDANSLEKLLAFLPKSFRTDFPHEIHLLEILRTFFREAGVYSEGRNAGDRVISKEPLYDHLMPKLGMGGTFAPNLRRLRDALRTVHFDWALWKVDPKEDQRLRRKFCELIEAIEVNLKSWSWYSKSESRDTLNTATLLVPESAKGAIILDATASSNVIYEVFDRARPIPPIPGTRNYQNVTMYVSLGHKTGKVSMRGKAEELSVRLISDLEPRLTGKKVLVVTHKDIEPHLVGIETKDFMMEVAHWGAVNGSNRWQDFDTVVLFGLPFRPDTWPVNVYMALQGVQDTEWLSSTGNRPFRKHRDIKEAIIKGQLVTDTVQAINRIRCRRVVDEEGNCLPADVYIMFPPGERGEAILGGIRQAMPGIRTEDWAYSGLKRKIKKSKHEETLRSFFGCMEIGRVAISWVRRKFQIPGRSLDRLVARIRKNDPEDPLMRAMVASGVTYETERTGKTTKAFFAKASPV